MNTKYLEKLEFNKIRNILETFAITYGGKEMAKSLIPSNVEKDVKKMLAETTEASILLFRKGNPPIFEIENIDIHLKLLESSNTLSAKYLLDLANILKLSRTLKEYISSEIDTSFAVNLNRYFNNLYSNQNIESNIFSKIIDENTIDDKASSTLYNIRKNIKSTEQNIKSKLNSYMHSKYVQESVITSRNGRFVIPVKNEYRSEIKGFIHDISASGSTVFVEPLTVFELNNDLNNLKNDESIEIEIILQKLSSLFFNITKELENNINLISIIDFIFAKGKYAKSINATEPLISNDKSINLIKARHPLIDISKSVANDIVLGKDFSTLVITGPNTGGKTVTLKTVGLLCLMAMSGLHITATEKSYIYVFDNIFADIGDEQSIANSLSTFSSHMINTIEITESATENSLILLDELGSGTDPIEGSSLAISILEFLNSKNILTIATTHYTEIKNFALVTKGFENASVEFDIETLSPTYHLLLGVPGTSNAFAISKKLGLSEKIINRAKDFVNKDTVNIEDLLKNIYDNKRIIEQEKENILKQSMEIEKLKSSLEIDNTDLKLREKQIIKDAKDEARKIIISAKEEANEAIKSIENTKNLKEANITRNSLNKKIENLKNKEEKFETSIDASKLKIGDSVFVKSLNQTGTILSLPNKDNIVKVQIGNIKMNFSLEQLEYSKKAEKKEISIPRKNSNFEIKNISTEINVIGLTVEEANFLIDKYLDNCVLSGLTTVSIVHGKGTGALRNGIHQFLKKNPHVDSYRLGTFGEGEMGVTIVTLK